mmetsp:Transcript_43/g.148  ORF Transcript_43/g.148 Transcript_43/m.148 type:complete len:218 (+) Transcript_43:98-751(+)
MLYFCLVWGLRPLFCRMDTERACKASFSVAQSPPLLFLVPPDCADCTWLSSTQSSEGPDLELPAFCLLLPDPLPPSLPWSSSGSPLTESYSLFSMIRLSLSLILISTKGCAPWSRASTLSCTQCVTHSVLSLISIRRGKVAGPFLSCTLFCVPRLLASSSLSVTVPIPPMRSARVGFFIRFSMTWPWAVPTSITPLSAIVRHARASASVPISSMITT